MEKYIQKYKGRINSLFKVARSEMALSEQDLAFNESCIEKAKASKSPSEIRNLLKEDWEGASEMLKSFFHSLDDAMYWTSPRKLNELTYDILYVRPYLRAIAETVGLCDFDFPTAAYYRESFSADSTILVNGLSLLLTEVKLPKISQDLLDKDFRKLLSEMKLALDLLIVNSVKDPKVLGLPVQKGQMKIFVMSLDCEALYLPRLLGKITLFEGMETLERIAEAVPILEAAKAIYLNTKKAVEERPT
ncbi:hypothetical protein BX616_011223, partial [Lobosporangium transversale]